LWKLKIIIYNNLTNMKSRKRQHAYCNSIGTKFHKFLLLKVTLLGVLHFLSVRSFDTKGNNQN